MKAKRAMRPTSMFMLTVKSKNHKTGKVPVSTSPKSTCPEVCPFKNMNGCYAESGPLNFWWNRCSDAPGDLGESFKDFCTRVRALPEGQIWRHNQAGDLVGRDNQIDAGAAALLLHANEGKHGYTYTHYPVLHEDEISADTINSNRRVIERMNAAGFTVNVSANSPRHLDAIVASGIKAPLCVNLPEEALDAKVYETPAGNKVQVCPALVNDKVTCKECQLCTKAERPLPVGFPVHGKCLRRAEKIITDCDRKW